MLSGISWGTYFSYTAAGMVVYYILIGLVFTGMSYRPFWTTEAWLPMNQCPNGGMPFDAGQPDVNSIPENKDSIAPAPAGSINSKEGNGYE